MPKSRGTGQIIQIDEEEVIAHVVIFLLFTLAAQLAVTMDFI